MATNRALFLAGIVAALPLAAWAQSGGPPVAACKSAFTDPAPRGSYYSWITSDDYPSRSLRNEEEGDVTVRFYVTADGRVESAEVVESNASEALQAATIATVMRRARFVPATRKCVPVPGEITRTFKWRIPA